MGTERWSRALVRICNADIVVGRLQRRVMLGNMVECGLETAYCCDVDFPGLTFGIL